MQELTKALSKQREECARWQWETKRLETELVKAYNMATTAWGTSSSLRMDTCGHCEASHDSEAEAVGERTGEAQVRWEWEEARMGRVVARATREPKYQLAIGGSSSGGAGGGSGGGGGGARETQSTRDDQAVEVCVCVFVCLCVCVFLCVCMNTYICDFCLCL